MSIVTALFILVVGSSGILIDGKHLMGLCGLCATWAGCKVCVS
jgi:hypothetical protein